MAIFSFILVGSILGFLLFNTHPARVFMGDTGSLALGGALAAIAILTHHELSLALIGGVFVIETLSSFIQIIAIRKFHKKVFLKASRSSGLRVSYLQCLVSYMEFGYKLLLICFFSINFI